MQLEGQKPEVQVVKSPSSVVRTDSVDSLFEVIVPCFGRQASAVEGGTLGECDGQGAQGGLEREGYWGCAPVCQITVSTTFAITSACADGMGAADRCGCAKGGFSRVS